MHGDLLQRALAADPARGGRVEAPLARVGAQRGVDVDGVGREVGRRPDARDRTREQPLAMQEARGELLVVAGRAHRDRQRAAPHADLQRLLDRDAVGDPVVAHDGSVHPDRRVGAHAPEYARTAGFALWANTPANTLGEASPPPRLLAGRRPRAPAARPPRGPGRARRPRSARRPGRLPARGWPPRPRPRARRAARPGAWPAPRDATRPAARRARPPARCAAAARPRACARDRGPAARAASAPRRPARRRGLPAAPRSALADAARARACGPPSRRGGTVRASAQWPWATSSPSPMPTRITSACSALISRTNGSARTSRSACRTVLRTATAAWTSAVRSAPSSHAAATSWPPSGAAATSVATVTGTAAGAGSSGARFAPGRRRSRRRRGCAPTVSRTSTCSGSPAWPRRT